MKTPLATIVITSLLLAFTGCGKKEGSTASVKPARETSFEAVTRQLDSGGSVYGFLSTDQWMTGLSTNLVQLGDLISALPDVTDEDRDKILSATRMLAQMSAESGLENLSGIGVSGIQVTPELHRTKCILHHGKGNGGDVLWSLMGKEPHALNGLNFLTTNTALAAFGDLDFALLWKTLDTELRAVPELAQALQKWPETFENQTRMSWPKLIESLGGEVGFVLTLDESKKISLPIAEGLELPEPGVLLAVKVNDSLLYDRISSELKKNEQAQITDEKGLMMTSMRVPIPLPLDLHIAVASAEGYFFLASSPGLIRNALAVHRGELAGLRKTPAFAELLKYLPEEGNQFSYVDPRFSGTIQQIQREMLGRMPGNSAQTDLIRKLFLNRPAAYGLSVSRHTDTGWESVSVGNQDSATALVAAPAVAAAAIGSAMILPALAKAKAKAQSITCVNNMKQIGLAFRIWAGDHDDLLPFQVSSSKGGTLEYCELDSEGYDQASFRHLKAMAAELNTPKVLVCPGDTSKQFASSFDDLAEENVSYQIRTGEAVKSENSEEVLIYCPVHQHTGLVDGSVHQGSMNGHQ